MKLGEGVAYMVAQCVGAIAGLLLFGIFSKSRTTPRASRAWAPTVGQVLHFAPERGRRLLGRGGDTFIFVSVVLFATHKAAIQGLAAWPLVCHWWWST